MENVTCMVGLRKIRIKKGFTQLKVAMDLNISREALSYYENGRRSPDLQMLILMSEYFDVSIDYLITGKIFHLNTRNKCLAKRCFDKAFLIASSYTVFE
jgi:transcriptional regulator with XRE-family HTH domain